MKSILKFIIFLIYIVSIFMLQSYLWIIAFFAINIIMMLILKVNFRKATLYIYKVSFVILLTAIFNILLANVETAVVITTKLLLAINTTYIFSNVFSYKELAWVIEVCFYPIKFFGGNSKDIGLIICICIAFIPILSDELRTIKDVFAVKGFKMNLVNIANNLSLIIKPFLVSIFQRVNELEISIKSKAYQE